MVNIMKSNEVVKTPSSDANPSQGYEIFPGYTWKKGLLAIADFGVVVASTATLITIVQSPLKSIAMNLTKNGVFFEHQKPWSYPAIAALYRGSVSALTGGIARSTYVVGSKTFAAEESVIAKKVQLEAISAREVGLAETTHHPKASEAGTENVGLNKPEKKMALSERLPNVALITAGDVFVTQISETKAQLTKAGIPAKSYKWNTIPNFITLSKIGVVSRFSGSMINFTAMCIVTDFYAKYIPGENKSVKQTLGGMLSGITAAVISFPFSYYRDYLITKVTLSEAKLIGEDKLIAPSAKQVIYDALENVKKMTKPELMSNARSMAKNAAVRSVTTAATFGIVAGVSSVLGSEPVSRLVDDLTPKNTHSTEKYKTSLEEVKKESPTEESNNVAKNIKP
jgi:hypothetical protein